MIRKPFLLLLFVFCIIHKSFFAMQPEEKIYCRDQQDGQENKKNKKHSFCLLCCDCKKSSECGCNLFHPVCLTISCLHAIISDFEKMGNS